MRHRREKLFGFGRVVPLDREAKVRVMTLARALMRATEPGKAYGPITAKALDVLRALLWSFHNAGSGKCFPSYETIADRAGCGRSTVHAAIRALERAGILTWCNRLIRLRVHNDELREWRWRVLRTSNAYRFRDPQLKEKTLSCGSSTGFGLGRSPASSPKLLFLVGGADVGTDGNIGKNPLIA